MLLFIDQARHIRVVRTIPDGSGTMKRERVGQIPKSTFEVPPELESLLQPEEKDEVAKAIDMYRQASVLKKQGAALNFPETMRVVTDYIQDGASESERKILVGALMEAVRLIRKAAKQEAEQSI
jgi:urease gamma subunit